MYNNHHQGIYTIRGDMCYENKLMTNVALPERPSESTCLAVPESDLAGSPDSACKLKRGHNRYLTFPFISTIIIIIIVGVFLFLMEYGYIPQTKLGFYCKDPQISRPFTGDTVSWITLLVGCTFGPIIVIFAIEYEMERCLKTCYRRMWYWYRDYFVGSTLALMIVEAAKSIVGEHRPHFFDTCAPDKLQTCEVGTYITDYECTKTQYSHYFKVDSSRSFPSGHAALSVFAGLFCVAYVHRRLNVRRAGIVFKTFVMLICIIWSLVCSLTRITDHRHHWWDVLFGSLVAAIVVTFTVHSWCKHFELPQSEQKPSKPPASASTTALLDLKNKDATSVII